MQEQPKPPWVQSGICGTRLHCIQCRNVEGVHWREALKRRFSLSGDSANFDCPHGVPWGYERVRKSASFVVEDVTDDFPLPTPTPEPPVSKPHITPLTWETVKAAYRDRWPEGLPEVELTEKNWTPSKSGCSPCQAKARMIRFMNRLNDIVKTRQQAV